MTILEKDAINIPILKTDFDILESWESYLNDLFGNKKSGQRIPATNIYESKERYLMELGIPGMEKNDFDITIEDDATIISAEKETQKVSDDEIKREEYNFSSFKRHFNVPKEADMDKIEAEYNNDVLSIYIPKKKEKVEKSTKKITIQ